LIAAGCADQGAPVAYVNGQQISQDDYLTELEMQQSPFSGAPAGKTTLNNMIDQRLLLEEARRTGVAPTQAELNAALQQLRSDPAFEDQLKQTGLTEDKIMQLLIAPQLATDRILAKMAGITDADVQAYFHQHQQELNTPPQVQARILQFTDRKRAEEAQKLVGKTSFDTIAQTFGGPGAGRVETLERQGPSIYPKEVVDAAFATPKGQATGIIQAKPQPSPTQPQAAPQSNQFYIVYVEDQLPARTADLGNPLTRDRILRNLIQEKAPQKLSPTAIQDLLAQLRKNASINVVRPSVKSVEEAPPAPPAIPGAGGPGG
jgi:parvulin-like peptidyl-prolyl isomerase